MNISIIGTGIYGIAIALNMAENFHKYHYSNEVLNGYCLKL